MQNMSAFLQPAAVVFYRQMLSWRTLWRQFLLMRLVEPTIFFYGISLGFGKLIPEINGYDYRSFLLPGSLALGVMFSSLVDGSYSAYVRAFNQRNWPAYLATPTRLIHIMLGEMAWCATRAMMSAAMLLCAGLLLGAKVSIVGFVLALPVIALLSMTLMAVGYVATGLARGIDDFDIVWAFLLTPMLVFSGVMVDIRIFPEWLQVVAHLLPLTHGLESIRPLMLGHAEILPLLAHMAALVAIMAAAITLAHRLLYKRLVA